MKKFGWLACAGGLILLSGCVGVHDSAIAIDDASTKDVFVAFTMSAQQSGLLESDDEGYVVLVKPNGETSFLKTTVMQNAQLDWNEDQLGFADTENDYILGESMQVIPTETKADYQQALFLNDDGTVTGLYNDGFEDDGYVEQLVTSSENGSDLVEVEGYFQVTGFCGGNLYGVAEPSGKYFEEAEKRGIEPKDGDGYTRLMLNQLTSGNKVMERNVLIQSVNSSDQATSNAPCIDDTLYHLASVYSSSGETIPVLREWQISSGEMTEVKLAATNDEPLTESEQSTFEVNGYSPESLRGNAFDWVDDSGRVWQTNIKTGASEKLFELGDEYDNSTDLRALNFTGSALTVVTFHREAEEVRLVQYDRDTGKVLIELGLPEVAQRMEDSSIWAVAAKD